MVPWIRRQLGWLWLLKPDAIERRGSARQRLGRRAERRAARWLMRRGYDLLDRNLRIDGTVGEIDLLCWDPGNNQLVLVEVKAGRHGGEYRPERHINSKKRQTLARLARALARKHRLRPRGVRVDVVAIEYAVAGQQAIAAGPNALPKLIERQVRHHANIIRTASRR